MDLVRWLLFESRNSDCHSEELSQSDSSSIAMTGSKTPHTTAVLITITEPVRQR